jgi:hypothetical protein
MRSALLTVAIACLTLPAFAENVLEYELDGVSDPANLVGIVGVTSTTYPSESGEGYTEMMLEGANWYIGRLDLPAPIDVTGAPTVEFDGRYYQDPISNSDPYADAPIAVVLVSEDANGLLYYRTLEWPFGPTGDGETYPEWTHVSVDMDDPGWTARWWTDEGAVWTPSNVFRIEFYGTDWFGTGDDHVDLKNLVITPEPGALALLLMGSLALLRRR